MQSGSERQGVLAHVSWRDACLRDESFLLRPFVRCCHVSLLSLTTSLVAEEGIDNCCEKPRRGSASRAVTRGSATPNRVELDVIARQLARSGCPPFWYFEDDQE
jgi:hypothetical protein